MESVNDDVKPIPVDLESLVEIELSADDDFLKIRETLTRIGIASRIDRYISPVIFFINEASIILFISKNSLHSMVRILILTRTTRAVEIRLQIY